METKILKIDEIACDEKYYPRMKWGWHTAFSYSQAMKAGAVFPPIEVAIIRVGLRSRYYLVDGRHRIEANKMNGESHIQAIINSSITNLNDLFIEAVKRNAVHGRPFSVQEKVNIALKVKEEMSMGDLEISKLINVPLDKLTDFVATRITNTFSGEVISLKAPVKHFAGQEVPDDFNQVQDKFSEFSQLVMLRDLINLFEKDLINFGNRDIVNSLNRLVTLVNEKFLKTETTKSETKKSKK